MCAKPSHICSRYTNSLRPDPDDSESDTVALAVSFQGYGAMSTFKPDTGRISNDGGKRLDISINMSHNRPLSRQSVIQLVKLLARHAAEEDYLQSIIRDQGGD